MCIKLIFVVLVSVFIVNISPQRMTFPLMEYLNNFTVTDLSNLLRQLPIPNPLIFDGQTIQQNDVTYNLYTRKNQDVPFRMRRTSKKFGYLNPQHEVKFIVHGWMEDGNRTYYRALIDAYLRRGEYNVIGVDWQRPALNEYTVSSRNTKSAGRELGNFIIRLTQLAGISLSQVHILGHSLGAHLSGFAGKHIMNRMKRRIRRITALDAAGPLFETPIPVEARNRLDRRDAEFVDCIHTDGGVFGMVQPIGHADFYPNGGLPRQPGCSMLNIWELSSRVIVDDMFCSHYRSHEVYAESINSINFKSTECDSYANFKAGMCVGRQVIPMGEDTDMNARGKFYLDTNSQQPFALRSVGQDADRNSREFYYTNSQQPYTLSTMGETTDMNTRGNFYTYTPQPYTVASDF